MTNNYLTKSPGSLGKRREYIIKVRASNLQKFVEARGEYQTTRYSASKPLNTS